MPRTGRVLPFVLALAVTLTLVRLFFSAWLGLGDDEAYYWDWSNRFDWSYFDHPAMTAWLIKAGTTVFGQTPLGVRFFGVVCNALSGYLLWLLGKRMFGRETAAVAALLYFVAPLFSVGGILMVPDAPMGTAWLAVALLFWTILERGDAAGRKPWLLAGVALGFGFLSKYTILLLAGSVVLVLLSDREWRGYLLGGGFWSAVLVSAILCAPIIIWNLEYDWPSIKFHLHDRQTGGGGANVNRWIQFWVSQAAALSPGLFFLVLGTVFASLKRWADKRWRFLALISLPTLFLFFAQALYAEFKPHWTAPAYTTLFIGAAELLREGLGFKSPRMRAAGRATVWALTLVIVIPLVTLFHVGTIWPVIPKVAKAVAPHAPWDIKFDPTNDLYGWDAAVIEAKRIRSEFAARGEEAPFLSSSRYQLVAQIAFAAQERVWRVSPTRDHYTFTQTPAEWKPLVGKSSIFITDNRFERDPRGDNVFESCEERPKLEYRRQGGELARRFNIWVCRGFKGFDSKS